MPNWGQIGEQLRGYGSGVANRVSHPLETLVTALKEGTTVSPQNPTGMFGFGGLTKAQPIFRGTQRTPDLQNVSRRLTEPGNEFGMHVTTDPATADLMQYNYKTGGKGGVVGMSSNVGKPLVLPDTGGRWTPDIVASSILDSSAKKGLKEDVHKFQAEYSNALATAKETPEFHSEWAKKLQDLIKTHGYDHISYQNVKEGLPSESAILFDNLSYKDPFLDTTK